MHIFIYMCIYIYIYIERDLFPRSASLGHYICNDMYIYIYFFYFDNIYQSAASVFMHIYINICV
jgi:hypothetical protein